MVDSDMAEIWQRRDDVGLADFTDASVAFQATDCRLMELNEGAAMLLHATDVPRTAIELQHILNHSNRGSSGFTERAVEELLAELHRERLVKRLTGNCYIMKDITAMNDHKRYLANPDVSCRIEDQDGAMLYNPDTKSCQVINAVGLELWQFLSEPRDLQTLAAHLCDTYDGVAEEAANQDAKAFLDLLSLQGFIGNVEDR